MIDTNRLEIGNYASGCNTWAGADDASDDGLKPAKRLFCIPDFHYYCIADGLTSIFMRHPERIVRGGQVHRPGCCCSPPVPEKKWGNS